MGEQPVLQDAFGAEFVAPVDDRHLRGMVGEIQRLFDRRVAAADDDHFLLAIEESVAGRAGRDAEALELFFRRQLQPARLGAGADDDDIGQIDVAAVADAPEGALGEVDLDDQVVGHAGADMLRLLLHLLHQPGALDDVGEARIVFDIRRDGQLAARLHAHHHARRQAGPRRVDRRRVAGRAGANDEHLVAMRLGHVSSSRRWVGCFGRSLGRPLTCREVPILRVA